jgi:glycosyltransferase involved in cell wall biosynthesis
VSEIRASVLLLAYRQQAVVGEAVRSLLTQQCEASIELLLSDDASDDGTYDCMCRAVDDHPSPHEVRLLRNERNLGIGAHLNRLVEQARGELLVIAAGDDRSLPGRVQALLQAFDATGRRADLLASPLIDLDVDGRLHGLVPVDDLSQWTGIDDWLRRRPRVIGAAQAWTRRMHQRFGPFESGIAYEDQIVAFRAICGGGGVTLAQPLVEYRRGGTSTRSASDGNGERRRMHLQNERHLAELSQLRRDAHTAGVFARVAPALEAEERRQRYVQQLLQASGWASRCAIFAQASQTPFAWRWRKFWQSGRRG